MPRAVASAPGKAILVGEHFVVEGEPAIAVALDLRARVSVETLESGGVTVRSVNLGCEEVFAPGSVRQDSPLYPVFYAAMATMKHIGVERPLRIVVESDIPPSAGMGSSAAVLVATVAATASALERRLSVSEVSSLAFEAEKIVHGKPSGIDNTVSAYGGAIVYRKGEGFKRLRGDFSGLMLVLADSNIPRNTGRMVARVLRLKEKYPRVINPLYGAAGQLALEAARALEEGDFAKLGELMNINHGLLSAVGVSNKRLEELVYTAREAGALGAKITGAGGGGLILALCTPETCKDVVAALEAAGAKVYRAPIAAEGVRLEE